MRCRAIDFASERRLDYGPSVIVGAKLLFVGVLGCSKVDLDARCQVATPGPDGPFAAGLPFLVPVELSTCRPG